MKVSKAKLDKLYAKHEKKINRALQDSKPIKVELNEPRTITVKHRNGKFSKAPLIGGEKFSISGCYVGKRGDLIMMLKPLQPAEYAFMEMKVSECHKYLDGFDVGMGVLMGDDIEGIERAHAEEEMARMTRSEEAYGDVLGSWA